MGTARLTELDVILTNPLENIGDIAGLEGEHIQGTGAAAIVQKTVTKNTVKQAGLVVTFNDAEGSNETKSMMIDLNGDGYPDIVAVEARFSTPIIRAALAESNTMALEATVVKANQKPMHLAAILLSGFSRQYRKPEDMKQTEARTTRRRAA